MASAKVDTARGHARRRPGAALVLAFGAIGILAASPAEAHFKLDSPESWMSQDSVGGPQKNGPCAATPNTALGDSAGTPTNAVTVVQPGQTLPVSISVAIAHPGWFRISLVEGASSTQSLSTLPDPQAQTGTNCTPAIMKDPVWSPTQPVLADGLPAGSTATTQQRGDQTFQVTIPANASCSSAQPCTLQVVMVMTDHPANDCYYHHCADVSFGSANDKDASADVSSADAFTAKDASEGTRDATGAGEDSSVGGAGGGAGPSGVGGRGAGGGEAGGAPGAGGNGAGGGSGGATGAGGLMGSGGSADSSGGAGSGSNAGNGGSSGSGGNVSNGGSGGAAGIGTRSPASTSSSGCSFPSRGKPSGAMGIALLGLLLALRGRRRRR